MILKQTLYVAAAPEISIIKLSETVTCRSGRCPKGLEVVGCAKEHRRTSDTYLKGSSSVKVECGDGEVAKLVLSEVKVNQSQH